EAFGIALSLSQAQGGSRNICRLRTFAGKYALCATAQPSRRIRTTAAHAPYDQALGPRLALLCADMTRTSTFAILFAAAALAAVAAQPAEPKVVEVEKLADNLFILKGGGGNTAAFVTAAGVVVVDTKIPGWGQPIIDKVKQLTGKPITTIINTHTHYDHVSGNVEFPASVDVVVQE